MTVGFKIRDGFSYDKFVIAFVELFLFHQAVKFIEVRLQLCQPQVVGFNKKLAIPRISTTKERGHVNGADESFLETLWH